MGNAQLTNRGYEDKQARIKRTKKGEAPPQKGPNNNNNYNKNDNVFSSGISNIPGIAPPPRISSDKKPNKKKEQIDTLPRHTGSDLLIASIAQNRESALSKESNENNNNNNNDNSFDSKNTINNVSIGKNNSIELNNLTRELREREKREAISTNNDRSPQFLPYTNNTRSNPTTPKRTKSATEYYMSDDERQYRDMLSPKNSSYVRKKNRERRRWSSLPSDDASSTDSELATHSDKGYNRLNKKKEKLVKNLDALNKLENEQKMKILEQKRQLEIQNMKLNDALLINKSLTNFNKIYDTPTTSIISDEQYLNLVTKYEQGKNGKKQSKYYSLINEKPLARQKVLTKFPSIVTKYQPNNYNNKGYDDKYISRKQPVELYLETTEDIVDEFGNITNLNKSLNYIGKSIGDLTPKVIYSRVSPINFGAGDYNHNNSTPQVYDKAINVRNDGKYEFFFVNGTNNKKSPPPSKVISYTDEDIDEIIKLVQQHDKKIYDKYEVLPAGRPVRRAATVAGSRYGVYQPSDLKTSYTITKNNGSNQHKMHDMLRNIDTRSQIVNKLDQRINKENLNSNNKKTKNEKIVEAIIDKIRNEKELKDLKLNDAEQVLLKKLRKALNDSKNESKVIEERMIKKIDEQQNHHTSSETPTSKLMELLKRSKELNKEANNSQNSSKLDITGKTSNLLSKLNKHFDELDHSQQATSFTNDDRFDEFGRRSNVMNKLNRHFDELDHNQQATSSTNTNDDRFDEFGRRSNLMNKLNRHFDDLDHVNENEYSKYERIGRNSNILSKLNKKFDDVNHSEQQSVSSPPHNTVRFDEVGKSLNITNKLNKRFDELDDHHNHSSKFDELGNRLTVMNKINSRFDDVSNSHHATPEYSLNFDEVGKRSNIMTNLNKRFDGLENEQQQQSFQYASKVDEAAKRSKVINRLDEMLDSYDYSPFEKTKTNLHDDKHFHEFSSNFHIASQLNQKVHHENNYENSSNEPKDVLLKMYFNFKSNPMVVSNNVDLRNLAKAKDGDIILQDVHEDLWDPAVQPSKHVDYTKSNGDIAANSWDPRGLNPNLLKKGK